MMNAAPDAPTTTQNDPNKKIEIAYKVRVRRHPISKRKIVRAKDLSKTIESLRDKHDAFDIFTRDAE